MRQSSRVPHCRLPSCRRAHAKGYGSPGVSPHLEPRTVRTCTGPCTIALHSQRSDESSSLALVSNQESSLQVLSGLLRVADDRDRGSRRTQIPRSRLPHFGLQRSRKAAPSPAGPCRPWPSSQQAPHEAIIDVMPAMTTDAPRSARAPAQRAQEVPKGRELSS